MSKLYSIQPEKEPIEFTHYDCWESNPRYCQPEEYADDMRSVAVSWGTTLRTSLDGFVYDGWGGSYEQALLSLGYDNFMDLVLMNVMRAGFDVYVGDDFVEIYESEGGEE